MGKFPFYIVGPVPVVARCKAKVCERSPAEILSWNPHPWPGCLSVVSAVFSGCV